MKAIADAAQAALFLFLVTLVPAMASADTITLYAAGSLKAALTDVAKAYEAASGNKVEMKFGPSGLLKDEIAGGARADVFASANMEHPKALHDAGKSAAVVLFARNRLCALVKPGLPVDSAGILTRMLDANVKLGISTPKADPSGDYAIDVFRKADALKPGAQAALESKALQLTGAKDSATPPAGRTAYGWHVAEGRADIFLTYCTNALAARVQEQTGIPYALLDGRFDAIAATYRKLGELTGRRDESEKLARYADDTLSTIMGRISGMAASTRPRVYYARGPRGLVTGLGSSINVETIEMLAQNVAGGNKGGLANVSVEQVLLWNPDVIVTIDRDFAANVRNDPAWASVAAVKAGRVHLSPKMPFGWVDFPPSVNRLIGLWWLAKILYPDKFPEDMTKLTRDFYTLFYHRTPDDAQIAHVLEGRE